MEALARWWYFFRRRRELLGPYPIVTTVFVAMSVLAFIAYASEAPPDWVPRRENLIWNAEAAVRGEWFHAASAMFLHHDLTHLLLSAIALSVIGSATERLVGNLRFLVIVLMSGGLGAMFSLQLLPDAPGAVGLVAVSFGLLGYLAAARALMRSSVSAPFVVWTFVLVIVYASWSLLFAAKQDIVGPIGGFVGGVLSAWVVGVPLHARLRERTTRQWFGVLLGAVAVCLWGVLAVFPFTEYGVQATELVSMATDTLESYADNLQARRVGIGELDQEFGDFKGFGFATSSSSTEGISTFRPQTATQSSSPSASSPDPQSSIAGGYTYPHPLKRRFERSDWPASMSIHDVYVELLLRWGQMRTADSLGMPLVDRGLASLMTPEVLDAFVHQSAFEQLWSPEKIEEQLQATHWWHWINGPTFIVILWADSREQVTFEKDGGYIGGFIFENDQGMVHREYVVHSWDVSEEQGTWTASGIIQMRYSIESMVSDSVSQVSLHMFVSGRGRATWEWHFDANMTHLPARALR